MAVTINNRGNVVLEINDDTQSKPLFFNFRDIVLTSDGDFVNISESPSSRNVKQRIDFNDVTNITATSGASLVAEIAALFGASGSCASIQNDELQIGSGTSNATYAPFYGLYDYSWYGMIFEPSELTGTASGEIQITGLSVQKGSTSSGYQTNDMQIWISEIDETIFDSGPAVDGADLTKTNEVKVFDGDLTWSSGFNTINFDVNYCRKNPTKSVLVEFRNFDGTWTSGYGHGEYAYSLRKAAYKYRDDVYPSGNGTRTNGRINTKFLY